MAVLHWLYYVLGLDGADTVPYLIWSGPFSDFSKLTIPATGVALWWHHRCHVRWCFRTARFDAGPWRVCKKHAPHEPAPTAEQVAAHRQ